MVITIRNRSKYSGSASDRAKQIIQERGGIIRTAEAIQAGIHPRIIYQLRDIGELEQLSRGTYRLSVFGEISNPDLVMMDIFSDFSRPISLPAPGNP